MVLAPARSFFLSSDIERRDFLGAAVSLGMPMIVFLSLRFFFLSLALATTSSTAFFFLLSALCCSLAAFDASRSDLPPAASVFFIDSRCLGASEILLGLGSSFFSFFLGARGGTLPAPTVSLPMNASAAEALNVGRVEYGKNTTSVLSRQSFQVSVTMGGDFGLPA